MDLKEHQRKAKNWPMVWYGSLALIPTMQSTFGLAFVVPAIPYYSNANLTVATPLTENQVSWFASITSIFFLFGTAISSYTVDAWGRKRSLLLGTVLQLFSWGSLQISQEFPALLLNRMLTGISEGIICSSCIALLSEISTVALRGSFGVMLPLIKMFVWMLSIAMAGFMDFQTSIKIQSLPMLLFLMFYVHLPESPLWLVKNGRLTEAHTMLRKLRGDNYDVAAELRECSKSVSTESKNDSKESRMKNILSSYFLKPVMIMSFLTILQANNGIEMLSYYNLDILQSLALPFDSYMFAICMQIGSTIGVVLSVFIAAQLGRKPHYLSATALLGFSLALITFSLQQEPAERSVLATSILTTCLLISFLAAGLGVWPVYYALLGELFPPHLKGAGSAIVLSTKHLAAFGVLKLFPSVRTLVGLSGIFLYNTVVTLVTWLFVFFLVPETHGLKVSQIAELFEPKTKPKLGSQSNETSV